MSTKNGALVSTFHVKQTSMKRVERLRLRATEETMQCIVAGTGTGVGKSYVTAALARWLKQQNRNPVCWKPIETGCKRHGAGLIGEDVELLRLSCGSECSPLYLFERPASPLSAASAVGKSIDFELLLKKTASLRESAPTLMIETAGGVRVPLTPTHDNLALMKLAGLPVLLVGTASLGTINHTCLSADALLGSGIRVPVIVLSKRPQEESGFAEENRREIERLTGVPTVLFSESTVAGIVDRFAS